MADARIEALRSSVDRLRTLVSPMSDADLTRPAYPSEWSVADVCSHIGSGAVIMHRGLDDTLAGSAAPDNFAPQVWDSWNAKTPAAQRDDALAADAAFLAGIENVTAEQRAAFSLNMGPMKLGFDAFVGMRLNEHAFHVWDIEVALDPSATIPPQVAAVVVDNLEMIARFSAKPTGATTTVTVATTEPPRSFTVALSPESVTFTPSAGPGAAGVALTAEAFARLVYGRLDPRHTPDGVDDPAIGVLRHVFPGP